MSVIRWLTPPHLHILAWAFLQSKTSQPTTKATVTRWPCLSDILQGQESVYWPGESGQLWTDFQTFTEPSDFPDGKQLFIAPLQVLYDQVKKVSFPCRVYSKGRIVFFKRINHWLLVLLLLLVIFLKTMYSQSDQTGTLDVLEIKISTAQPLWADFWRMF